MASLQSLLEGKELQPPSTMQGEAPQPSTVPAGSYYGERRVSRSRMALADHVNVLSDEGGILLPKGLLPEGWATAKDVRSIPVLSRDFVFPGEHLHILVHTRPPDPPPSNHSSRRPSLVIPARDLLPGTSGNFSDSIGPSDESASVRHQDGSSTSPTKNDGEKALRRRSSGGLVAEAPLRGLAVPGGDPPRLLKSMSSLRREGALRRSQLQLDSLRRSHFYVQLSDGVEAIPNGSCQEASAALEASPSLACP